MKKKIPTLIFILFWSIISYCQSLDGSYTIGNNPSDDFATLEVAVSELIDKGINGPIIFGIRPGTYDVTDLNIPMINGTSATNTITFQPLEENTIVILQSSTFILKATKSDYLNFNNLTFKLLSDNYFSFGIYLHGSSNANITNCKFTADFEGSSSSSYGRRSFIYLENLSEYSPTSHYPVQNITIKDNSFYNGNGAIYCSGNSSSKNNNITVFNNIFEGKSGNDIRIFYTKNISIKNNVFSGNRTDHALEFAYIDSDFEFSFNKQFLEATSGISAPLYIRDCLIDENSSMTFKNNFFSSYRYISILRSNNLNIWNNSFYNKSDANFEVISFTQSLKNISVINNIFKTNGTSLLYFEDDVDFSEFDIDYNSYNTANNENEFIIDRTNYNFKSWKTLSKKDNNSILAKPNFYSQNDLHLNNDVLLNGKGKVLPDVVTDIDGEVRDTGNPDIGADEFNLDLDTLRDIEVTSINYENNNPCNLLDPIQILVKNNSAFTISSFDIEWWLNLTYKGKTTVNENIEANSSKIIYVGSYSFAKNTTYNLKFKLSSPNGKIDNDLSNNELTKYYTHFNNLNVYKEKDNNCSDKYTLYVKNQPGSIISWSTGENTNFINVTKGIYSVTVTSANGCSLTKSITVE